MSPQTSEAYQVHLNDTSRDKDSPTYLSNLVLATIPKPNPGAGEVLVRIRAAALNYRDLLVLVNSPLYPAVTSPGLTPLADGSGEIESVGPNSKWADSIGQGVVLVTNKGWLDGNDPSLYEPKGTLGAGEIQGTLRQYAVVKDELLLKKPGNLSFEEAAAMVACAGTAMHALEAGELGKGSTVLTQGTGGVSCATILLLTLPSLASALGARVIATSSSDEKLQAAKSLGATDLINYKTHPNWSEEVLLLTGGKGVDLVVDVAGGATIEQSIESAKIGGTVDVVGFLGGMIPAPDILMKLLFGAKILKGIRGNSKTHLKRAIELMEKSDLHPLIGEVFSWQDAPKAFETLRKGEFVGKLVIKV